MAKQQLNALAAELALLQQEVTQLQITQWQPILAAFDQQLQVMLATLVLCMLTGLMPAIEQQLKLMLCQSVCAYQQATPCIVHGD